MTEIKFSATAEGVELRVVGHANYNPGHDIVCAAVSMLVNTYASLVEDYSNVMDLQEMKVNAGEVIIRYRDVKSEEAADELNNYNAFVIRGSKMLQEGFPDYVSFTCLLEN
ncbi:MAG: ribosomal-processing cysteine protease Prp [Eubacterium sp.]|nr:ribosomal-processing cysteine protease Prp [Eubacterium sp.]